MRTYSLAVLLVLFSNFMPVVGHAADPVDVRPPTTPTQLGPADRRARTALAEAASLIRAEQARAQFNVDGTGLTAAVIDTGINVNHLDFQGKIAAQLNFTVTPTSSSANDDNGHGSNVAGIIAANGVHVGVAPGANLISLKVLNSSGGGSFANVEKALDWVIVNYDTYHISVVNLSLADGRNYTTYANNSMGTKIKTLRDLGIAVVVAAGNSYFLYQAQGMGYPAILNGATSVGAVFDSYDSDGIIFGGGAQSYSTVPDQMTSFTQRLHSSLSAADATDIFGPGGPVISAGIPGETDESENYGTSQAAPTVSGMILLLQQQYLREYGGMPTVDQLERWLRQGATSISDEGADDNVVHTNLDYQRFDAVNALQAADDEGPPSPPNPPVDISKIDGDFRKLYIGWASGGGGTKDYSVSYVEGAGALPACSAGTRAGGRIFIASNLKASTLYTFGICARSAQGIYSTQERYSASTSAPPIPPMPIGLSVVARTDSTLKVSWTSGGMPLTGYTAKIIEGANAPFDCAEPGALILSGEATELDFYGRKDLTDYTIALCAMNQISSPSPTITFYSAVAKVNGTTAALPPPLTPAVNDLRATSFGLEWITGGGAVVGYATKIVLGNSPDQNCEGTIDTGGSAPTQLFTGLSASSTYTYVVCAKNNFGHYSAPLVGMVFTPDLLTPYPPSGLQMLSAAEDFRQLKFSWNNSGGTTASFLVAYTVGTVAQNCQSGIELPAATTSYETPNNLHYDSDYTVSVCSRYKDKFSSQISSVFHTSPKPLPSPPLDFSAIQAHDSAVDLSWTSDGGGAAGFRVAYSLGESTQTDCTGPASQVLPLETTSLRVHGLSPNTLYTFAVCAVNEFGFDSLPVTTTASTALLTSPPPVLGLKVDAIGDYEASISWISGSGNTFHYRVGVKMGSFTSLSCSDASQDLSTTSFSRLGLQKDFDYTFVVCAKAESGALSEPSLIQVHTTSVSPAPMNFRLVSKSDSAIRLAWEPRNKVVKKYLLVRRTGTIVPGCKPQGSYRYINEPAHEFEWSGLKPGTTYSFSLCGLNHARVRSRVVSLTLATLPRIAPPRPENFKVVNATDSTIHLIWTSPGGNTAKFRIVARAGLTPPSCLSGGQILDRNVRNYEFKRLRASSHYAISLCALSDINTPSSNANVIGTTVARFRK